MAFVHHRQGHRVVVGHELGAFLLVGVGPNVDDIGIHDLAQPGRRRCFDQVQQADHATEATLSIHDEQEVAGLGFGGPLPHGGQSCGGGHMAPQGQELGGHQAAGAVVGEHQQRLHAASVGHLGQRSGHLRRQQVAQKVGSLVGGHLVQDRGQGLQIQAAGQLGSVLVLQLLQDVGGVFDAQPGQEHLLLAEVQFFEDVGLIGRAQRCDESDGTRQVVAFQVGAHLRQRLVQHSLLHDSLLDALLRWAVGRPRASECSGLPHLPALRGFTPSALGALAPLSLSSILLERPSSSVTAAE